MAAEIPSTTNVNQTGDNVHWEAITKSSWNQDIDFYKIFSLFSSCKNDNSSMKGIQRTIKNLQNSLENIKKYSSINSILDELSQSDKDPNKKDKEPWNTIKKIINYSAEDISSYVKDILGKARGWVLNKVQDGAKKIIPFLFPGEVPSFLDKLNTGLDGISCAFAKIVRSLFKTVGNLLNQLIDKYINGPMCLIEDFVNKLLNQILEPIFSAIQTALKFINSALSFAENIADSLLNMLDFVSGILNFFKCDDDKKCPIEDEINLAGTFSKSVDFKIESNFKIDSNVYQNYSISSNWYQVGT